MTLDELGALVISVHSRDRNGNCTCGEWNQPEMRLWTRLWDHPMNKLWRHTSHVFDVLEESVRLLPKEV